MAISIAPYVLQVLLHDIMFLHTDRQTPPQVIGPEGELLLDHTIGAKVTQETNLTFDILIRGRFKNQYRTGLHKQLLAIRRITL